ncbi:MAG: hypothetical protein DIAAKJNI_00363 [Candidatus Argoarchaeum ethanivorans]|uniref:Uncharacterized protein n=1 Tax=Candidatus Argoarchaeum ethanivorans TaxID=2608793 RepID=A0A811T8N5_9EURY|nr:MAG: hypothetical protein DIAAKJNI_00363 [Candidatus Argoarchaeum ethanivorans]
MMQEILLKTNYLDEQIVKSRAEVIKRVEELEDHYILQALLNNFRKTGEPRFFNLMVRCLEAMDDMDRRLSQYS